MARIGRNQKLTKQILQPAKPTFGVNNQYALGHLTGFEGISSTAPLIIHP
jgi:hypothetical protein